MKASLSTGKHPGVGALMIALLVAGCASTEQMGIESSANPIVGTWRLVSFEMEVQGTNGSTFPIGRAPSGYLSFLPDGRMAAGPREGAPLRGTQPARHPLPKATAIASRRSVAQRAEPGVRLPLAQTPQGRNGLFLARPGPGLALFPVIDALR